MQSRLCQLPVGIALRQRVHGCLELSGRLLIVAVFQMQLSQIEVCQRVVLLIAHGIVVGSDGFVGKQDAAIAVCQLHGALPFQFAFLAGCLRIGLTILCGGIVVFADGIELVAFLHRLIRPAAGEQQRGDDGA